MNSSENDDNFVEAETTLMSSDLFSLDELPIGKITRENCNQ